MPFPPVFPASQLPPLFILSGVSSPPLFTLPWIRFTYPIAVGHKGPPEYHYRLRLKSLIFCRVGCGQFTRTTVKNAVTSAIPRRRAAELAKVKNLAQQEALEAREVKVTGGNNVDEDHVDPPHVVQASQKPAAQPIAPGESGNTFVTDQPFQVLSWYPRWASPPFTCYVCLASPG
jgi:hypothetical protein